MKFRKNEVDRLAQLLNFAGFALYAVRRAVNFGEIDPLWHFYPPPKFARKMLMKFTPVVNLTNILLY